jgi:hypothetical protein
VAAHVTHARGHARGLDVDLAGESFGEPSIAALLAHWT